jgi:hypothetical protein
MPKRPEPAKVTASVGVQESVAGGIVGARWPLVPPPLGEIAMCRGAEPKLIVPPVDSSGGRAECPRRFLILRSILLQSTITGHPDLLLRQPQFGLPCVGTT